LRASTWVLQILITMLLICSFDLSLVAEHLATRYLTSVTVLLEGGNGNSLADRLNEIDSLKSSLRGIILYVVENIELKINSSEESNTYIIGVSIHHPFVGEMPIVQVGRPIVKPDECLVSVRWANKSGIAIGDSVRTLEEEFAVVGLSPLESYTIEGGEKKIDKAIYLSSSVLQKLVREIQAESVFAFKVFATFVPRSPVLARQVRDRLVEATSDAQVSSLPPFLHPANIDPLHSFFSRWLLMAVAAAGTMLLLLLYNSEEPASVTVTTRIIPGFSGAVMGATLFLLFDILVARQYLLSLYAWTSLSATIAVVLVAYALAKVV